jgi:hypothetical protein
MKSADANSPGNRSASGGVQATPAEPAGAFRETRFGWLVLAAVWAVCAVYTALYLKQGWIPFDSGTLGELAVRALGGQLPHRDFIDNYTGGLTYLNALAFRLLGVNLFSLRVPLFLCFLAWVPAVYGIARRFAAPLAAAVLTLLAVAWSVPNYAEAMPSWYNLFFATWGVLALIRYTETERPRWLWIAGLCGGLSFLVKITGLYFVAGALLFFVYRELLLARRDPVAAPRAAVFYRLFAGAGLLLFLASVVAVVAQRPTAPVFVSFAFPAACLVASLLWEIWREPSDLNGKRFRRLFAMGLPFLGGVVAPVLVFLAWYARQRALAAWFQAVFLRPGLRTHWGAVDPISLVGFSGLVPALLIAVLACDAAASIRRLARYAAPPLFAVLLLVAWHSQAAYSLLAYSTPLVVPLLALAVLLGSRDWARLPGRGGEQAFLLFTVTIVWTLVQFPRSPANYFYYVAPLAALSLLALFSARRPRDRVALGSLLVFYLVFAVWLHPPNFAEVRYVHRGTPMHLRPLALARAGGIRVPATLATEYETVTRLVLEHARGPYIYAGPDCPEVYFLSSKRSPTGTFVDPYLESDFFNPLARSRRLLSAIRKHGVTAVVLHVGGWLDSGPMPAALRAALESEFPLSRRVGDFDVRWKP